MSFLSETTYYFFLSKLFFNFIFGGLVISAIFLKLFSNKTFKINSKLLLSFGMGFAPYLTSILLYYLLCFIPNQSSFFYFGAIGITYLGLAFFSKVEIKEMLNSIKSSFRRLSVVFRIFTVAVTFFLFMGWSFYINYKPIAEHDKLEYAVQGKVFFDSKKIEYSEYNFNEENAFYYVGLHGYSFPLIASWERIQNELATVQSDLLFRSLNSIYGILIVLTLALIGYLYVDKNVGLVLLFALPFTYGFFETMVKYHIDFYRIFFLNLAVFGLFKAIKTPSVSMAVLLGILLGAQANAHSLGALLFIIQFAVFFFFIPFNLIKKLKLTSIALLFALAFGAIHYIIDIIWGTGWIFQEIKFY